MRMILHVLLTTAALSSPSTLTIEAINRRADSLFAIGALGDAATWLNGLEAEAAGDSSRIGYLGVLNARLCLYRGDADGAAAELHRAIGIAVALADTVLLISVTGIEALVAGARGNFARSRQLNETRLELALAVGDRVNEAWARTGLAYADLAGGDAASARDGYRLAIDRFDAAGQERPALTARVGLGRALAELGDIAGARDAYEDVLRQAEALGDLAQQAHAHNNLGYLEQRYGDPGAAAYRYRQAQRLQRDAGVPYAAIIPMANQAQVYADLGEFARAMEILGEAHALCELHGFVDVAPIVLKDLGWTLLRTGRVREAQDIFQRARSDASDRATLSMIEFGLVSTLAQLGHVDAAVAHAESMLTVIAPADRGIFHRKLCELRIRQGRYDLAETHACAVLDTALTVSPGERLAAMLDMSTCASWRGDRSSARDWLDAALDAAEEHRETIDDYRWREVLVGTVSARIVECAGALLADPGPAADVGAFFDAVERTRARVLLDRMAGPGREAAGAKGPAVRSLGEVQRTLAADEVLVQYAEGVDHLYIVVATSADCSVHTVPIDTSLTDMVDVYRELMADPDNVLPPSMVRAVARQLVGPVGKRLAGARRVWVVPDAKSGALPFDELVRAVVSDVPQVALVPSASFLVHVRESVRDNTSARSLVVQSRYATELGGARREASFVTRCTGAELVTDVDAVNRAAHVESWQLIHVAAHAILDAENPWRSGVMLGDASHGSRLYMDDADAGVLHGAAQPDPVWRAGAIAREQVDANLVVLAACASASGRPIQGEGVVGLSTAFLSAGVPAVVGSLWPVDDRATADLMRAFYARIAEGATVGDALADARAHVRSRAHTSHPFYWAGFVLIGNPDVTLVLDRCGGGWRVGGRGAIAALAFVLLVAAGVWIWGRRGG